MSARSREAQVLVDLASLVGDLEGTWNALCEADPVQPSGIATLDDARAVLARIRGAANPPRSGDGILHVHGPGAWHDPACLVLDLVAARDLRVVLTELLAAGRSGDSRRMDAFAADGEGFSLVVTLLTDPESWRTAALPYHDEIAAAGSDEAVHPLDRPGVANLFTPDPREGEER